MKQSLDKVLEMARRLSGLDKLRLIQQVAPLIEQDLANPRQRPRKSLRGLWRGTDISEEDIAEARRDM